MSNLPYNSDELIRQAQAMLAQTQSQGSTPFAGSSYDKSNALVGNLAEGTFITDLPPRNDLQADGGAGYDEIVKQDPNVLNNEIVSGILPGESVEQARARINNTPFSLVGASSSGGLIKTLSGQESAGLAKSYGLSGLVKDDAFAGNTPGQAAAKAEAFRNLYKNQTSQLTSYNFNPESLNKVKDTTKNLQLNLNEVINDTFNSKPTKQTNIESFLAGATNQIADAFSSTEEFNSAYQNNPSLQKSLDSFVKAGGSLEDIQTKIQAKSIPQTEQSQMEGQNIQSTFDYRSSLDTLSDGTPAAIQAEKAMFVEGELAKQEIARQYNMSNEVQRFYFGDDKTIGLLEQNKKIAEEKLNLIKTKLDNAETSTRAQADYEIQKNNAEVQISQATIEQNRLNAKNYMTGMLAKLGALQTTGAAPLAIATLDQKYQQQKTELDSRLYYTNQQIRINLKKDVNDIETKAEDLRISIQEDLSKDEQTAFKEIMKAQQDAQKEIYNITKGYAKDFKTTKDKYEAQAKSNSDKYISSFMTLAGKGINLGRIASMITPEGRINTGMLTNANFAPKGKAAFASQKFDSKDTETFFNGLPAAFKSDWAVNFPSWEGSGKATKEALKADYVEWLANNPGGKKASEEGGLSKANMTKGINYLLNNGGTQDDVYKFKTDREFQAWVMEQ